MEGGGEILVLYVFLTFLDDLLYYGYNTASNNSACKGGGGVWGPPPENLY